jgi:GNAT superfamily N-acetyltransferase
MIGKNTSTDRILTPSHASPEQLDAFAELVLEGRQIREAGLRERLAQAHWLGFHYENDELAAVAALKRPSDKYRARVFHSAAATLPAGEFLAELGWVFTREGFRRQGISQHLLKQLLDKAGKASLFATARTANGPMRGLLESLGFQPTGRPYVGTKEDHLLQLWVRRSAGAGS